MDTLRKSNFSNLLMRFINIFLMFYIFFPATSFAEKIISLNKTNLILSIDYELGQSELTSQKVDALLPAANNAIRIDCTQARNGRCSLLTHLLSQSDYVSQNAWRAESNAMKLPSARYSPGDHFLYRFSLRLADDWDLQQQMPSDSRPVDIIWQFKRFDGPPDMFVAIKAGMLVLRIAPSVQLTLLPAPLPLGRWIDLEFEVRWASDEHGEVNATAQILGQSAHHLTYTGPNMRDNRAQAGYLKWGLYLPDASPGFAPRTVWHDSIKVYRLSENY